METSWARLWYRADQSPLEKPSLSRISAFLIRATRNRLTSNFLARMEPARDDGNASQRSRSGLLIPWVGRSGKCRLISTPLILTPFYLIWRPICRYSPVTIRRSLSLATGRITGAGSSVRRTRSRSRSPAHSRSLKRGTYDVYLLQGRCEDPIFRRA